MLDPMLKRIEGIPPGGGRMSGKESTIEAARSLAEAFDALGISAMVVDNGDHVIALTAEAQKLVEAGSLLRLNSQMSLEGPQQIDTDKLRAAVQSSRVGGLSLPQDLRSVHISSSNEYCKVTVTPLLLDRDDKSIDSPTLLVIEKPLSKEPVLHPTLKDKGLTQAEVDVAMELMRGKRMAEIARGRHVSIETVRSQVKTIYSKLNVSNHIDLLMMLRR